jgi:hypothetical protein
LASFSPAEANKLFLFRLMPGGYDNAITNSYLSQVYARFHVICTMGKFSDLTKDLG